MAGCGSVALGYASRAVVEQIGLSLVVVVPINRTDQVERLLRTRERKIFRSFAPLATGAICLRASTLYAMAGNSASDRPVEGERAPLIVRRGSHASDSDRSEEQSEARNYQTLASKLPPGARVDPAELEDALSPEERRRSLIRWTLFWLIFGTFTVVCIVLAIKRGGAEFDFKGALKKALGGGVAGAAAMVIQVLTLMPLRTTMNYQLRSILHFSYAQRKSEESAKTRRHFS